MLVIRKMENLTSEKGAFIELNPKCLIMDSSFNMIAHRLDCDPRYKIDDGDINLAKNCSNVVSEKCLFLGGVHYPKVHHGHWLIESLCRWWVLCDDSLISNIDMIVFCLFDPALSVTNITIPHLGDYLANLPNSTHSNVDDNSLDWVLKLLPSKLFSKSVTMVLQNTKFENICFPRQCMRLGPMKNVDDFPLARQSYQFIAKYWSDNICESSRQKLGQLLDKSKSFYLARTAMQEYRLKAGTLSERVPDQHRVCSNETELEAMLQNNFNIISVRMEKLSMQEQIYLVAHAELIIGLYGSAMHNIVFAKPGTRCLTLCDIRTPDPHATQFSSEKAAEAKGAYLSWRIHDHDPITFSRITWCYTWNLEKVEQFIRDQLTV